MSPTPDRIGFLSREDRIVYRQWLRRIVVFYGSVIALLVFAAFANHVFAPAPSDVADETMHTASIVARK